MKRSISLTEDQIFAGELPASDSGNSKKKIRPDPLPETQSVKEESPETPVFFNAAAVDSGNLKKKIRPDPVPETRPVTEKLPETPDVVYDAAVGSGNLKKKFRPDPVPETQPVTSDSPESVLLDENLLYEVLKHVDARTLGAAGCVNRQWHRTAQDERLWELICTKQWTNIGCGNNQLRAVVLALGGFRRLHSHYLWPLSKPSTSSGTSSSSSTVAAAASSSSAWPCLPPPRAVVPAKPTAAKTRWGKDEVQLSLSLLSIRYYEKMNFVNRK